MWLGGGVALALAGALLAGCGGGGGNSGSVADTTGPSITDAAASPSAVRFYGGAVTLSARVTDAGGVAAVWADITRAGAAPVKVTLSPATAPLYQGTWTAPSNAGGSSAVVYTVRFGARDTANNTATSAPLTVTVEAADAPPPAPDF